MSAGLESESTSLPDAFDVNDSLEDASASWLIFGDERWSGFEELSSAFSDARDLGFVFAELAKPSFGSDDNVIGIEASCSPLVDARSAVALPGYAKSGCSGPVAPSGVLELVRVLAVGWFVASRGNVSGF